MKTDKDSGLNLDHLEALARELREVAAGTPDAHPTKIQGLLRRAADGLDLTRRVAPVAAPTTIQPWEDRTSNYHTPAFSQIERMEAEIADLRAALANQPASLDNDEPYSAKLAERGASVAEVRAAERVEAMHKGVVGVFAAIKAEHEANQPGSLT